ncbi:hypothetical protein I4U23_027305 [Adineta vaga]|nr:hypothetical protein I4U23_027305 [Adineta vaga]
MVFNKTAAANPLCQIKVIWYLDRNETRIELNRYKTTNESLISAHLLSVTAIARDYGSGSNQRVEYSFEYLCSTDRCNNVSVLQRLLESLTIKDEFDYFKKILPASGTYDGRLCLFFSNQTDESCYQTPPDKLHECTQCTAEYFYDETSSKICATCQRQGYTSPTFVERIVVLNITNQTRSEQIEILCGSDNCTTSKTGDLIREKSTIELDFDKFLAPYPSGQSMMISSFYQIIFMNMIFILQQVF